MFLFQNTLSGKFTIDVSLKSIHNTYTITLLPSATRFPQGYYFLEGSKALPICFPGKSILWMKMRIVLLCGQNFCKVLEFMCGVWGKCCTSGRKKKCWKKYGWCRALGACLKFKQRWQTGGIHGIWSSSSNSDLFSHSNFSSKLRMWESGWSENLVCNCQTTRCHHMCIVLTVSELQVALQAWPRPSLEGPWCMRLVACTSYDKVTGTLSIPGK